jgi:hypothetical protein
MGMQTDVKSATLVSSGFMTLFGTRVKGISTKGTASAGQLDLFDTTTAPVAATYGRSTTTITVTSNGHGLKVGDKVGIAFEAGTGGTATSSNYIIATVPDANTFTVTDINSGSVTAGAVCNYAGAWLVSFRLTAGDTYANYWLVPGEGILARNGIYARMTNLTSSSIFYG